MSTLAVKKINPAKPVKAVKAVKAVEKVERQPSLNTQERIAVEAYLLAEKRGFQGGDPFKDWLEAEAKVVQVQDNSRTSV